MSYIDNSVASATSSPTVKDRGYAGPYSSGIHGSTIPILPNPTEPVDSDTDTLSTSSNKKQRSEEEVRLQDKYLQQERAFYISELHRKKNYPTLRMLGLLLLTYMYMYLSVTLAESSR
jgi:hypothetical protein